MYTMLDDFFTRALVAGIGVALVAGAALHSALALAVGREDDAVVAESLDVVIADPCGAAERKLDGVESTAFLLGEHDVPADLDIFAQEAAAVDEVGVVESDDAADFGGRVSQVEVAVLDGAAVGDAEIDEVDVMSDSE